jgi:hypothetical protein
VHARANQRGRSELFGLLQLGHCPTHGVVIKSGSVLVLSRARPRSQSPSPDTPTRLGPIFLKARRIAANIAQSCRSYSTTVTCRARPIVDGQTRY